jgi:hypothetical protein
MRYAVGLSGGVAQDFVQYVRIGIDAICLAGGFVIQFIVRGLQGGDLGFDCIQWRSIRHAFHKKRGPSVVNCGSRGKEQEDA